MTVQAASQAEATSRQLDELLGEAHASAYSYLARTIDALVGEARLMDRLLDRFCSSQA